MERKTDIVVAAFVINDDKLLLVHHGKLDKWLPPGGHMEENETPDDAVIREIKEETDIDVEFVHKQKVSKEEGDNIIEELALPFYANVHNVGDHDHACMFYLCTGRGDVTISHESKGFKWVTLDELMESADIPSDVKKIGKLAFKKLPGEKKTWL